MRLKNQRLQEQLDNHVGESQADRVFSGVHIIIDFWGSQKLDDIPFIERTLKEATSIAGATMLHIYLHHFTPNDGVSGVAVLAESHISIHTWPERNYAAIDIFMCGSTYPEKSLELLIERFAPKRYEKQIYFRG